MEEDTKQGCIAAATVLLVVFAILTFANFESERITDLCKQAIEQKSEFAIAKLCR